MKLKLCYLAIVTSTLLFQGCGGGGLANGPKDTDDMKPVAGVEDTSARPRPPENAVVITTDQHIIYDADKKPVFLRGISLDYAKQPTTRINGIPAIKATKANVVRLLIDENTTDTQLEGALATAVTSGLITVISFTDSTGKLSGSEDGAYLLNVVDNLWLKKWAPVIAQDRFQANIMINIASGWGPSDIFNQDSLGYQTYIDTYKSLIRKFRTAGWKVPLVIDAPSNGQDFNAFLNGRSRELTAADSAKNLVFGINIEGPKWNTSDKIFNAATLLYNEKVPFIATGLAGSGVANEGDAPVDHLDVLAKSAGDPALDLTLPWTTTDDAAAYVVNLPSALDLRGGAVLSTQVFLDKLYAEFELNSSGNFVQRGKLKFVMYAKDASGNALRLGSTTASDLRSNQWSKLSYSFPRSEGDIDPTNYLNGASSFDLTAVKSIGIEIIANGKPASLKADIKFDDLAILPGVPPVYVANFDASNDEWIKAWGSVDVGTVGGALSLKPTGGDFAIQLAGWNGPSINTIPFNKVLEITHRIYLPASYNPANMWGKLFGQFGSGWTWVDTTLNVGNLKAGQWNEIKTTVAFNEKISAGDINTAQAFGMQIGGFSGTETEPILIDSISISDPNARPTKTVTSTQYKATFTKGTEGFVNAGWDNGKATLAMVNGELQVTLPAGDNGAINKADINSVAEIDFKGNVTIKFKLFVPADWAGKDFAIKPFMQDGNWNHYQYAELKVADLVPGDWANIEIKLTSFPSGFSRVLKPQMFGFQFNNAPGGVIKFDDIEVIGDTQVDDSKPVFTLGFSTQAELDSVKFDFGAGSFTESALASAKSSEWKVIPFGWLATSWKGTTNGELDISKAEDIVDLTARGEDIVNSTFGIKATSVPATISVPTTK
jgi:hypothetical protein